MPHWLRRPREVRWFLIQAEFPPVSSLRAISILYPKAFRRARKAGVEAVAIAVKSHRRIAAARPCRFEELNVYAPQRSRSLVREISCIRPKLRRDAQAAGGGRGLVCWCPRSGGVTPDSLDRLIVELAATTGDPAPLTMRLYPGRSAPPQSRRCHGIPTTSRCARANVNIDITLSSRLAWRFEPLYAWAIPRKASAGRVPMMPDARLGR